MDSRKWVATDADGNIVQTMEVIWPDGHPDPDGAIEETRAEVEGKGLTFVILDSDDELPDPSSKVLDIKTKRFKEKPPPEPTAEERTVEQLVDEARADLNNPSASKAAKREAAAFLKTMGELR